MPGKKKKWLFVINPVSGDIDKTDLKQQVKERLEGKDIEWEWMETTGKEDLLTLEKEAERGAPDIIVAGGGDGTIHMVAQVAVPRGIAVGILPLGSANGLARELTLPSDPLEALSIIEDGELMELDVLKINDMLCIHLCDIGLNATVVKRFEKAGYRGIFGYFRQYLREIRHISTRKFILKEGGKKRELKAVMVIATHTSYLGTGAVINPKGDPQDGLFEVCIIRKFPMWMILQIILSLFTGGIDKLRFVTIRSYKALELENVSGADFQIDGEPRPLTRHLTVKTNDRPMRVIIPKEKNE